MYKRFLQKKKTSKATQTISIFETKTTQGSGSVEMGKQGNGSERCVLVSQRAGQVVFSQNLLLAVLLSLLSPFAIEDFLA